MSATDLATVLDTAARASDFSGVIRVDRPGAAPVSRAYGLADRARQIPATVDHRFGVASITKGFTVVTVGSLIDAGQLGWNQPVRTLLGDDLPLTDDRVTVAQLLSHTSGIGDYLDESEGEITDYVLDVPVHRLDHTEAYLPLLDGRAQVEEPGQTFRYNNAGFVLLALVAERATGVAFAELVGQRVFTPAGMSHSGFPRSDEPTADLARHYLAADGPRTNVLHLPVVGSGDGGAATTAGDLAAFWSALLNGRLVSPETLARLTTPVSEVADEGMRYGHGFWLGLTSGTLILEGYDAGVSGRSWHDPATGTTATVIANWSDGAWPVLRAVDWS
ncbi:serine hydrolase domain-containing protein [Cellulomonas sp. NPDC089187]|uniref:serine hydrolase domain-containing protein n=1 Tax=Cellulomonas sp. NPDC089187 TaxID=3154970 RepID=UPI003449DC64